MLSLWHVSRVLEGGINMRNRSSREYPRRAPIDYNRDDSSSYGWPQPHPSCSALVYIHRSSPQSVPPILVPEPLEQLPASPGPSRSGSSQYTTPFSHPSSESVTITHPHHPLRGQCVTRVRVRQGADPDLIVRLPDGSHAARAMSSTDYAGAPADALPRDTAPLLALEGLRQAVRLVERFRQRARVPPPPAASMPPHRGDSPYEEGR